MDNRNDRIGLIETMYKEGKDPTDAIEGMLKETDGKAWEQVIKLFPQYARARREYFSNKMHQAVRDDPYVTEEDLAGIDLEKRESESLQDLLEPDFRTNRNGYTMMRFVTEGHIQPTLATLRYRSECEEFLGYKSIVRACILTGRSKKAESIIDDLEISKRSILYTICTGMYAHLEKMSKE